MKELHKFTDKEIQEIVEDLEIVESEGNIEEVERISALLYKIKEAKLKNCTPR